MHGHGGHPPGHEWPDGAKIAVQFVVNYEEGGESCILHGDPASEAFLSETVGAEPWPGQRNPNMESVYEYGARAGFWRLHRLFTEMDVPVTVYGVAEALARSPAQTAAMLRAGWEIASHGLKWLDYRDIPEERERDHMRRAIALHREVTGERPLGWYTGRCSDNTVRLVGEEGGFEYAADSYADDLPYWIRIGEHDQLIVPYTLDCNDMRFGMPQGFNSGDQFHTYLKDTFDTLYAEGAAGSARMMSVGLHCRLAGRPGRFRALRRFLDHARGHPDVWFARRIDIARHWREHHPPPNRWAQPSEMDRESFVRAYGSVFEHSAWIAEGAYELELGPAHDTADGLHNALCRVFRAAPEATRLGVLKAHPDLAGKLAAARRLGSESTAEQSGAGLDALTEEEHAAFEDLNRRYAGKFGFPFIMAVRDHDKNSILSAFRSRIENSREREFAEACRQVERIAHHRLADLLPEG